METREEFVVRYESWLEVEDIDLVELVEKMVKMDFGSFEGDVKKAVEELTEKAMRLNYKTEDLEAKVEYLVSLFKEKYFATIIVKVYPKNIPIDDREEVALSKYVCMDATRRYVSQLNKAERNEVGLRVKSKLKCYERLSKLITENEELKREVENLRETVDELSERIDELMAKQRA